MKVATGVCLPRKRRMVCQNTLFADLFSVSNYCPNAFNDFSLDCLTIMAAVLRVAEYRNRSCLDDLFDNQALNAVFFVRIASLTSWFHQAILFLPLI